MIPLLTLPEVALRLRISEDTLRWLRHTGQAPPAIKVGRRLVWKEEDVDEWIRRRFEGA